MKKWIVLSFIFLLIIPQIFAQKPYIDPLDPRINDPNRYVDPNDPRIGKFEPQKYLDPTDPREYQKLKSINFVSPSQGNIQFYSSNGSVQIIPDFFNSKINFIADVNNSDINSGNFTGDVTGTINQIQVTNGTDRLYGPATLLLKTPQDLNTNSSVIFGQIDTPDFNATLGNISVFTADDLTMTMGGTMRTGSIYPVSTNTFTIGNNLLRYDSLFVKDANFFGKVGINKLDVQEANVSIIRVGHLNVDDANIGIDDLNNSQSCGSGQALSSVGNLTSCISFSGFYSDANVYVILQGQVPWTDTNVANDLNIDSTKTIHTTKNLSADQNLIVGVLDTNSASDTNNFGFILDGNNAKFNFYIASPASLSNIRNVFEILSNGGLKAKFLPQRITAGTPIQQLSDGTLYGFTSTLDNKTNLVDAGSEIDTSKVWDIKFYGYDGIDHDKNEADPNQHEWGYIAEYVAQQFPEMAIYNDEGKPINVKYTQIAAAQFEEVKKMKVSLDKAENDLILEKEKTDSLTMKVTELTQKVNILTQIVCPPQKIDPLCQQLKDQTTPV